MTPGCGLIGDNSRKTGKFTTNSGSRFPSSHSFPNVSGRCWPPFSTLNLAILYPFITNSSLLLFVLPTCDSLQNASYSGVPLWQGPVCICWCREHASAIPVLSSALLPLPNCRKPNLLPLRGFRFLSCLFHAVLAHSLGKGPSWLLLTGTGSWLHCSTMAPPSHTQSRFPFLHPFFLHLSGLTFFSR